MIFILIIYINNPIKESNIMSHLKPNMYYNNPAMTYIAYSHKGIRRQYANEYIYQYDRDDKADLLHSAWEMSTQHQTAIVHYGNDTVRFYYSTMSSGRDPPVYCERWKSILFDKPKGNGWLEYNVKTGQLEHYQEDQYIRTTSIVDLNVFKTMVASMYSGTGSNFILFNREMLRRPALDDELFFEEGNENLTQWLDLLRRS